MDSDLPVVFASSFEGLRRAVGPELRERFDAGAAERGLHFEDLLVAYPLPVWLSTLDFASLLLVPDGDEEARYRTVGQRFVRGFSETAVGKAARAVGRALGARRMLQRMGRNFQTGTNYLDTLFIEHGPRDLELSTLVNARFKPHIGPGSMAYAWFRKGILEETIAQLKVDGRVEIVGANPTTQEFTYRITW